jgi:long-chain acyl-CoA synthetase
VPRIWEKFYSGITIALKDATPFQNWMYRQALAVGYRMTDCRLEGERRRCRCGSPTGRLLAGVPQHPPHARAGPLPLAFTGAAPIAPDLIRWYLALGIDMREVYGQTENCGVATVMPAIASSSARSARPRPGARSAISPQGEILIKGDFLFMGYLNQPEKTAETIDAKGWLHTGDVGSIDNEGFVKITDRMKDIIITSGGKNITPSEIENQLKFSPYISDAVVIGDKRPYLTCLIMIDQENVEKFAQDHDIPFTNYASLCRAAEIQDLIQREIEAVNANFARVETIKKFFLIERQLTPEDEELTPTMKLKRSFVNKRYAARSTPCMASGRWRSAPSKIENGEGLRGPTLRSTRANEEETAMSKSFKALGLAVSALALTHLPAAPRPRSPMKASRRPRSSSAPIRICPARSRSGACRFPTA